MMEFDVGDLVREIRVVLDENMVSTGLEGLGDVDTLSLDEIVRSKIADSARRVMLDAPLNMLDGGTDFSSQGVTWHDAAQRRSGHVLLPGDFLRLVGFRMSDWERTSFQPIQVESSAYAMQSSRYKGIRGCRQRPVTALVMLPDGLALEFYSCGGGNDVRIEWARYLPIPFIEGGRIPFCEKLRTAVVYHAASMVAMSIGRRELGTWAMGVRNEELGIG